MCINRHCLLGDYGRIIYLIKVLFVETYVNVIFVNCLYSVVSLTRVREWCLIRIFDYYYYSPFILSVLLLLFFVAFLLHRPN